MKWYRLIIVWLTITFLLLGASYCEDENDEIDTGLPLLQKIIGTDEHILADDSAKYCFDGKKEFLTPNILEDLANICFTVYKFFIQIEIILVALSYKLELFTLMKDQIAVLMKPITVVFYDTWKIPVLLILLLFIMIKSLNSKNTYVIGQVVIAGFVLGISIIFLGNPVGTLEVGYDVVSSMNEMILKESSIAGGNTDDYIVNLCNQLWVAQVEKPWEILNFNNKANAVKYKAEFLKYNHGTEERDKLTEELRENVPEQGYNWVATSFFIGIIQTPKIAVIVILAVLNLGTDVMIVLLTIVSGIIFLLSLVPGFGVGVLLKWFEKIVSAFVVSVLVTSALTILNEFSSLLYGQVDKFNVLGVLIIELVIMLFLVIFRGWIFSGIKALRHGERGAKAAIENTPGSKHVFDTTSSFLKEDMYSIQSRKSREEPTFKFWSDKFENKSDNSGDRSSNSGSKYRESDSNGSNSHSEKDSSSEYYKYYNYKRKQERKDKEQANGKSEEHGSDNSRTDENYIRFSDYDEKEKINSKYEPEIITDDMTKEEQARVYLNNQFKDVLREKEIFETTNVTLDGKAKEFKVDRTTSKIIDRQKKGEPLFTEKEVFKASVYIENSSSDKNISRSEFANNTSANLSDILSNEKKYSANNTKETYEKSQSSSSQSEEKHSQKDSSNNNFDDGFRKSSDNQQYYEDFYNKHKDNKENHNNQEEQYHSEDEGDDFEYREHYKSSSNNDTNDMKTVIKEITIEKKSESEDELKESLKTIVKETLSQELSKGRSDSRGSKFDEILKNDIEEKREVEEINKKLDKIEKKVDKDSNQETAANHKISSFENATTKSKAVSLGDYDEKD